jgi:hypothetical protein
MFSFPIYQLNLRHSYTPTSFLLLKTRALRSFIALVQESLNKDGRPKFLDGRHTIIRGTHPNPRALIYAHNNVRLWPYPEYCARDVASALWDTNTRQIGMVMLVSLYWHKDLSLPPEFSKCVDYCLTNGITMYVGSDANAHSPLWGSPLPDPRGTFIETFLFDSYFVLLNSGDVPTLKTKTAATHIDISFCSHELYQYVEHWGVSLETTGSDHRLIETRLLVNPPEFRIQYSTTDVDWDSFR